LWTAVVNAAWATDIVRDYPAFDKAIAGISGHVVPNRAVVGGEWAIKNGELNTFVKSSDDAGVETGTVPDVDTVALGVGDLRGVTRNEVEICGDWNPES